MSGLTPSPPDPLPPLPEAGRGGENARRSRESIGISSLVCSEMWVKMRALPWAVALRRVAAETCCKKNTYEYVLHW